MYTPQSANHLLVLVAIGVLSACPDEPATITAAPDVNDTVEVTQDAQTEITTDIAEPDTSQDIAPDTRDAVADAPPTDTAPDTAPELPGSNDADVTGPDTTPDVTEDADIEVEETSQPAPAVTASTTSLALAYVVADGTTSQATLELTNSGDAPADLSWTLTGDTTLTTDLLPDTLAPGASHTVTVTFSGASATHLATATLIADIANADALTIALNAVAGSPDIGTANPELLEGPPSVPAVIHGTSMTVDLPSAPYPSDPSVLVFIPDGFRDRGAQDIVVHFHGHNTTLASTVPYHDYREQLHLSGRNAVLVVPQGPVNQSSGNFGALMDDGGMEALLDDVVALLYREGFVTHPALGDLLLTAHSGGYQAVAVNLNDAFANDHVLSVGLFDAMYGYMNAYYDYILGGGRIVSNYNLGGTTDAVHTTLTSQLDGAGVTWTEATDHATLLAGTPVLTPAPVPHNDVTWRGSLYLEHLRWPDGSTARGPRIELLSVAVPPLGPGLGVAWRSPNDPDVDHFAIQQRLSDGSWQTIYQVPATLSEIGIPTDFTESMDIRVVGVIPGLDPAEQSGSDVYHIDPSSFQTLIVDGFDRTLRGSFAGPWHDFAARVGAAVSGGVATASNEAIIANPNLALSYSTIIWLLGDEGVSDRTLDATEQGIINGFIADGRRVIISGSEVAYDLDAQNNGAAFLANLGATYAADNAGTSTVSPVGPLSGLGGDFGFGGPGTGYEEDYPDVLSPANGAEVLLQYATGGAAAVGTPGGPIIIGFPLELVDDEATLAALMEALLDY